MPGWRKFNLTTKGTRFMVLSMRCCKSEMDSLEKLLREFSGKHATVWEAAQDMLDEVHQKGEACD